MNQQANKITEDIKALTASLDSMVSNIHKLTEKAFENVSPEEAVKFAEMFNAADINGKMKEAKEQVEQLKKTKF